MLNGPLPHWLLSLVWGQHHQLDCLFQNMPHRQRHVNNMLDGLSHTFLWDQLPPPHDFSQNVREWKILTRRNGPSLHLLTWDQSRLLDDVFQNNQIVDITKLAYLPLHVIVWGHTHHLDDVVQNHLETDMKTLVPLPLRVFLWDQTSPSSISFNIFGKQAFPRRPPVCRCTFSCGTKLTTARCCTRSWTTLIDLDCLVQQLRDWNRHNKLGTLRHLRARSQLYTISAMPADLTSAILPLLDHNTSYCWRNLH